MDIGPPELLIVLVLVLVLFGSSRLPKLARSLGEAKREFEKFRKEQDAPEPPAEINPAPKALPEKASAWTDTTPDETERVASADPPPAVDGTERQ